MIDKGRSQAIRDALRQLDSESLKARMEYNEKVYYPKLKEIQLMCESFGHGKLHESHGLGIFHNRSDTRCDDCGKIVKVRFADDS